MNGFHGGGKALEREPREGGIWGRNRGGVKTPNFIHAAGA